MQQPRIRGFQEVRAEDQGQSGRREGRVCVRIASGHGTSGVAKSGRNGISTLRPASRLTSCSLCAPEECGSPGPQYYFC